MPTPPTTRTHWLVLGLLAIPVLMVAWLTYEMVAQTKAHTGMVMVSRAILTDGRSLLTLLLEREAGERGFVLTGNADYLATRDRAHVGLAATISRLRNLTSDDAEAQRLIQALAAACESGPSGSDQVIRLRQEHPLDDPLVKAQIERDQQAMEDARSLISAFIAQQDAVLNHRVAVRARDFDEVVYTLAGLVALILAFALVVSRLIKRASVLQRRVGDSLHEAYLHAEDQVRERTVALRASELRFQTVAEITSDAIWDWDVITNELWWNRGYQRLFGYPPEETSPTLESWTAHIHPEDLSRVKDKVFRDLAAGVSFWSDEYRFQRRDGSYAVIHDRGQVFRDAAGKPLRMIGGMSDITASKEAEAALRQSQELHRTLARNFPKGAVLMFDAQLRYLIAEGSLLADAGVTGAMMEGSPVGELFGSQVSGHIDEARALFRAALAGNAGAMEFYFNDCVYHLNVVPVRNLNGDIFAGLAVAHDITERKQAEAAIRELNLYLERRVEERTALLALANQELEAFSYSVSHDLRAPLRSIDGFSQALLEDCGDRLDATGRDHLQRVRRATARMGELIDDLLDLSRVSRLEMKLATADLGAIAQHVADELLRLHPERAIEFVIARGLEARCDEPLMRIVFENLLGNACKFTSKLAQARIEFGARESDGKRVYFVRDNGAGFDMAYVDKLFGAFQRLHAAADFPGTGIGLATVQRVIQRHAGEVWAEGAVGQGATFSFSLP